MKQVLIMEDNLALAFEWRDAFALNHFEVALTHNGEDAVSLLETRTFDLVVTDLMVEDGPGGLFVISKLTRMGRGKAPPVIAVTGAGRLQYREEETNLFLRQAVNLGASATIEKPFGAAELLVLAHDLIDHD